MSVAVLLPRAGGRLEPYALGPPASFPHPVAPARSRVAFAAAHVVRDPLADGDPAGPAQLDWEATLAYRRHLWSYGLRVAEAMDTAQRGMGLDWAATRELIRRSVAEARACGGEIACGAGTDQLAAGASLDDVRAAYEEQLAFVEREGAAAILMASRALAAAARGPDDYRAVYGELLRQARRPVILHWLGEMFDPALAGYWNPTTPDDLDAATDVVLDIVGAGNVDGIKVSLLDAEREAQLRDRLPDGVRLYTGDDFNYPQLMLAGSDALLGIFDAIAPAAAAALAALDEGDAEQFARVLAPTVPLARHIFSAPTYHYKTGLVFLAWLNGHQDHFQMVGGHESARSAVHLAQLLVLADRAGLLDDPPLAAERMRAYLALAGVR
jgi:hypothetical protein